MFYDVLQELNADSNAKLQTESERSGPIESLKLCKDVMNVAFPSLAPVSHRAVSFCCDVKGGVGRGLRHLASGPPTEPACRKKPVKFAW